VPAPNRSCVNQAKGIAQIFSSLSLRVQSCLRLSIPQSNERSAPLYLANFPQSLGDHRRLVISPTPLTNWMQWNCDQTIRLGQHRLGRLVCGQSIREKFRQGPAMPIFDAMHQRSQGIAENTQPGDALDGSDPLAMAVRARIIGVDQRISAKIARGRLREPIQIGITICT